MRNPRPCWACGRPESAHGNRAKYTPAKRTEPLRARRAPAVDTTEAVETLRAVGQALSRLDPPPFEVNRDSLLLIPEPSVPVQALRDFLDAELIEAHGDREASREVRDRCYYSGVSAGLYKVRGRFC